MIRPASICFLAIAIVGCSPRPRMCVATSECAAQNACVAGRCQPSSPTVKPAVDNARRWIVAPADLAFVKSGDPASDGSLPPLFALGKNGGVLFLRFEVSLPKAANVIEAYVCLRRATVVDDDPSPISLHATRIIDSWEGRSTSWAFQPRLREARTPATVVEPAGPGLVRIDVRDLVRNWFKHDPSDQGIAIVAENESRTGMTFALTALGAESRSSDLGVPSSSTGASGGRIDAFGSTDRTRSTSSLVSAPDVAPYLELYIR